MAKFEAETFSRFIFLDLSTLEKFKITLEQIFLAVVRNNHGNKIPFLWKFLSKALITIG